MKKLCILMLVMLSAGALMGQEQAPCPWLSVGTAARALGGDATVTASVASGSEGSCHFSRLGTSSQGIDILVGKTDTHPCPSGSAAAPALGNEAVQCHVDDHHGAPADTIAGRIRDTHFVISMTSNPTAEKPETSTQPSEQDLPPVIERVAEMVVGSLY